MIKKIEQTIHKYSLLENGDRVVVALSGGPDSCALLMALLGLAESLSLKIIVAHYNHGLRDACSDADELFCRNLAQKSGLVFVKERMAQTAVPKGVSPEDYFRRQRYRFLNRAALDYGANKIALGHHLNDQAETVLQNMLRGSGLDGLKGFLPIRESRYIRPLMEVSRPEIIDFLRKAGVDYREDQSNQSDAYLRNRIRGELIPFLRKKFNPRIEQNLARTAEIIRRDDEWINGCVDAILSSGRIHKKEDEVSFSAEYFQSLHASLGYRVLKALLEELAPEGGGFSSSHFESLANLAMKRSSGKKVSLPHGLHARKEYDRVIIASYETEKTCDYEYPIKIPGTVALKERHIILSLRRGTSDQMNLNAVDATCFDEDRIQEPLVVRNRRSGDWFEPLGTRGSQKIKKLFIDRKVPRTKRDRIALIADRESVIWIENMHLSERVKVSPATKNVLILEIRPLS